MLTLAAASLTQPRRLPVSKFVISINNVSVQNVTLGACAFTVELE